METEEPSEALIEDPTTRISRIRPSSSTMAMK